MMIFNDLLILFLFIPICLLMNHFIFINHNFIILNFNINFIHFENFIGFNLIVLIINLLIKWSVIVAKEIHFTIG